LAALESVDAPHAARTFLRAFHYPLAGEVCFTADLARRMALESSWGVELGMIHSLAVAAPAPRVCQIELCRAYDHRHRPLSPHDPTQGLHHTAREVVALVWRRFAHAEIDRSRVLAAWDSAAMEALRHAATLSHLHGLDYRPEAEAEAVQTFRACLALES
jgi:glucosyl-3-phosphoglycerate synthase